MTQHKCGTCRFFEEGGIAGSGWCRHPLRQDIQNMVLVRKNELACRYGWDQDLWEPRDSEHDQVPVPSAPGRVVERGDTIRHQETDRVTTVTIAPAHPAASAVASGRKIDRPARPSDDEPEPLLPRRLAAPGDASIEPARSRPPRDESPWSGPQALNPSDGRQFGTAPLRDRADQVSPRDATGPSGDSNRVAPPQRRVPPLRQESPPAGRISAESRPAMPQRATSEPPMPRSSPRAGNQPPPRAPEPQPRTDVPPLFGAVSPVFGSGPSLSEGRSGWTEPFAVLPEPEMVPRDPAVEARAEPTVAMSDAIKEPPPAPAGLAALPRCCATCRDFRPAEGGDRGWCNNKFAFDHRQMVNRDDLACQGSIGDWWTPTDDWWLQRADISHHGRPTPTVDELLHRILEERASNRRRTARS